MLDHLLAHLAIAAFAAAIALGFECVRRGRMGLLWAARGAAGVGALLTIASLLHRGLQMNAFPVVSVYETHLAVAALVAVLALTIDLLRGMPILTLGSAPLCFLALLVGALMGSPDGQAADLTLTRSPWTGLHVLAVLAAYGSFAMAFVSGLLYLIEQRQLKTHATSNVLGIMPSLETFSRLTVRSMAFGVALMSVGIVIGYLYARRAIAGQAWRVDAKVWGATLTWAVYLGAWILSTIPAFKGRRTALASVACFVVVMITFWVAAFWSNFHRFM
jgi:ABC-type uncharacterized transport system permease subunit